jgi:hypothetical protein
MSSLAIISKKMPSPQLGSNMSASVLSFMPQWSINEAIAGGV